VHDAIDPQLDRRLGGVSHVRGVSKYAGTGCRFVDEHGSTCDEELTSLPAFGWGKF
jgi:hypothetical protein